VLKFIWSAKFIDGTRLNQFNNWVEQADEVGFKEVLDRQDELVEFELINLETKQRFAANLINGTLSMESTDDNETQIPDADILTRSAYSYRLIYFRRVSRSFNQQLREVSEPDISYFLGFQYNDENGKCHKRIMRITNNGKFIIN